MLVDTIERVKRYWKDQCLKIEKPLDRPQLDERFSALRVNATEELVTVFSALNGFTEMMDDELFAFWPVDQMIEENCNGDWVKDRSSVHFADFLIFSHTFAFKQNETPFAAIHCHYASDNIVKVADSFEEFFEYYLSKDPRLSGGIET